MNRPTSTPDNPTLNANARRRPTNGHDPNLPLSHSSSSIPDECPEDQEWLLVPYLA
jgi:hypothetical protein